MTRRIGGHVSTAGGVLKAVANTLAIGGNCMQIFAGSPRMWSRSLYPDQIASSFRLQTSSHDIAPVVIHALYLTNLASDQEDLREKSRQALISDMKNAAAISSLGVVLHIGSHQGRGFDHAKPIILEEIGSVLQQTPEEATLILENAAGQKGKIGSLDELGILLKELQSKRVKVCLDTAHAFEAGHAIHTEQGLELFVREVDKHIGWENVVVIHLNDSRTKFASGHDQHENIGEGYIGASALQKIINHPKIKKLPLILEVPGFDGAGPDAKNISIVKKLVR